jgi:hypothetical protein
MLQRKKVKNSIHTRLRISHNLSTRCVRNRLVGSLSTSCNNVVILSSCYKVVTRNLLTDCWTAGRYQVVGTTCNNDVELNNLVASCRQAVDNLLTSWEQAVANTSWWQVVGTALLQVCCLLCYNLCVFTCIYHA